MGGQGAPSEDGERRVSPGPAAGNEHVSLPQSSLWTDRYSRHSFDHQSVTFPQDTADMPSQSRKRNTRRADEERVSSADESAPIIRRERGGPKDYHSISPSIATKTTATEGTGGRGCAPTGRVREQQRQDEREAQRAAADTERKEQSQWRRFLEKYGSVELENKGSVARDHLALERTFLAWLRTSLSFASIGIAITQLFRLNTTISSSDPSLQNSPKARLRHVGKPLGAAFIAISIIILFMGFHRYFESQHYVIRGKFPASRGSIVFVALMAAALILASLVVILAVAPKAFEH
ncbi:hypothetical protein K469DRAFT_670407 [Zopfia rhizophila CBS 207.26]|uniref:DUF202 domain-containing protein n=1 Tax=Zopfia rhizophila CBS 207.26 TaxID=1314779 RepID=A0A6A6DWA7_9PEZI|nr:hypothetical protein K469DRAFT_670407 [Zopfia rhizophila CBS 207.26]